VKAQTDVFLGKSKTPNLNSCRN